VNLQKLDEAIAHIEKHPEQHDQGSWFARTPCGTVACLAGTVALLDGWSPAWPQRHDEFAYTARKGSARRPVRTVAREILDATRVQESALFFRASSIEDIKRYRDLIAAGEL
jgi:hypothetical protein